MNGTSWYDRTIKDIARDRAWLDERAVARARVPRWLRWLFGVRERLDVPPPVPPEIARDKVRLGNQAKRLLDDPVLQLAFQRVEEDIVSRWKMARRGDTEAREVLYHMQAALQDVRAQLQSFLGDAKLLEAEQRRREAA